MFALVLTLVILMFLVFVYLSLCLILSFRIHKALFLHRERDSHGVYVRYEEIQERVARDPYTTYYYGKQINGYLYHSKEKKAEKGFVILSHGKFGTHIQYLVDILRLVDNGYQVLAYDQLGSGMSQGEEQQALATGIYVAENVIHDVLKRKLNKGLPLFVYGHSWGAYSRAGAIGNYKGIKGAVIRSAPIDENSSVLGTRKEKNPRLYYFLRPAYRFCMLLIEGRRFTLSAVRGVKKNKRTPVLMIYSMDDQMVSNKASLALYFKKHPQKNVKVFITEKGLHNSIITEESYKWFATENKKRKDEQKKATKEKKEEEILSLHPLSHIVYNRVVVKEILDFLDDKSKA